MNSVKRANATFHGNLLKKKQLKFSMLAPPPPGGVCYPQTMTLELIEVSAVLFKVSYLNVTGVKLQIIRGAVKRLNFPHSKVVFSHLLSLVPGFFGHWMPPYADKGPDQG